MDAPGRDEMFLVLDPGEVGYEVEMLGVGPNSTLLAMIPKLGQNSYVCFIS
jgi:hypothetical protein